jgi:hypothetical protein
MVRKYKGGQFVPGGTYWNSKDWEFVPIAKEGDYLPADEGIAHYRVPLPLVFVLGPLMGLAFILTLPLLVPVVVIYMVVKLVANNAPWRRHELGHKESPARR